MEISIINLIRSWDHRIFIVEIANDWQVTSQLSKKIVIHGNQCIILFRIHYLMSSMHNSFKSNHQSFISQLSPRTVFSDLALWRHYGWSMMSRVREALAFWRHIRRLFLYMKWQDSVMTFVGMMIVVCKINYKGQLKNIWVKNNHWFSCDEFHIFCTQAGLGFVDSRVSRNMILPCP